MRRILHLIDTLKIGGAQTHLLTMLESAKALRPEVEHRVVSLFGDGELRGSLEELDVDVEVIDASAYLSSGRVPALLSEIFDLISSFEPDVVEAHLTYSRLIALPVAVAAGVPLRIGFEQGDIYLDQLKFRVANFLAQFAAHRVVVCSEALGLWNQRTHGVQPSRLEVFHNCVDTEKFRPLETDDARLNFGFDDDTTVFAAVGTLGRGVNKRMDLCVEAIVDAKESGADVALVICGDGELRNDIEEQIAGHQANSFVKLLGMRSDVPAVLRACDAFCHAAPFEPFGIVALEAMASGLPVVVPDAGGISEAVVEGETGFVYPVLNVEMMSEYINELSLDVPQRESMGRAARRHVEEKFTAEAYTRRLLQMYDRLNAQTN